MDISEVKAAVEEILDESIGTLNYVIPESRDVPLERLYVDLSQLDFEALKAQFDRGYKHTEAEKLKGASQPANLDGTPQQKPDELPRQVPADD